MKDSTINIILILELHMINKFVDNNYRSQEFEMQRSKEDLSGQLNQQNNLPNH